MEPDRQPHQPRAAGLRPAYGSGEDWNCFADRPPAGPMSPLRPAYGSGEDWNTRGIKEDLSLSQLRPAYWSGEDWNTDNLPLRRPLLLLRPAYGSGEDCGDLKRWDIIMVCRGWERYGAILRTHACKRWSLA